MARDITDRKQSERTLTTLKDAFAVQLADVQRLHEMSVRLSTTLDLQPILEETLRTAATIEGTDLGLLSLYDQTQEQLVVGASLGFPAEILEAIERLTPGGKAGECATAIAGAS